MKDQHPAPSGVLCVCSACTQFSDLRYSNTAVVGISSLGYDHVQILGKSIEEIAWQKAGIIKHPSVVVTAASQPDAAMRVLQCRATEKRVSELLTALLRKSTTIVEMSE